MRKFDCFREAMRFLIKRHDMEPKAAYEFIIANQIRCSDHTGLWLKTISL